MINLSGTRRRLVSAGLLEFLKTKTMRLGAVAATGAAAALALGVGLAQANATPTAGRVVHLYEAGTTTGNLDTAVFTGAISDYGVDHVGVLDHGSVNKIVLKKGSFEANIAKLNAKFHPISEDLKGCSIVLAATAPVALSHGTGAYRGIRGSITVTVSDAVVFKVKGGKCAPSPTAPELANVTEVTASGRVSF